MFYKLLKPSNMKKFYFLFLFISFNAFSQNVTITKIIEAGCASPYVKSVELYVDGTVDFSTDVVINYMQNGAPWADNQIDVTGLGTVTDSFVYIVRDIALMQTEFPGTTFTENVNTVVTATATSGDDGYQVVLNGLVVSQFGKTETDADDEDGTAGAWSHNDAVATRKDGVPDTGVWDRSHWDITAENDLDAHTSCQNNATTTLETYFATLGSTYSLGSGSGWTPTAATCTTALGDVSTTCTTKTAGAANDTYSASIAFSGGNNGKTFVITTTSGTIGGDNPTSTASGTITISDIAEGTDITVTLKDTADGGVCDLSKVIESPFCIPLIINEVLYDPASDDNGTTEIEGDANGDGTRDAIQDEFIEFFNNSDDPLDISGYKVYDSFALGDGTPRHIFPASTVIPPRGALVLFGGGTPTGNFGGAIVQTASEGATEADRQLNLSNGGDIITIKNTNDITALVYSSSDTGIIHSQNQSVTRSPDLTGAFVLHTDANASLAFSPGLKINGTVLNIDTFTNENFVIYPNPVTKNTDFITINSRLNTSINISVFNILGKKVKAEVKNNNQVYLNNLSTGIYLIKISKGNSIITKKILVK